MLKKICNILIYTIFLIGIIIFIIGFIKVKNVNNFIETGVEEVEKILNNSLENSEVDMDTIIENEDKIKDKKNAIGLITFKLKKIYKVAVYNNLTEEGLKKGAGRVTR